MLFILMSVVFGFLAIVFTMSAISLPTKRQAELLLGESTAKQVVKGNMDQEFGDSAKDDRKHGFGVKIEKDGRVTFTPNSTVSSHAMRKALES